MVVPLANFTTKKSVVLASKIDQLFIGISISSWVVHKMPQTRFANYVKVSDRTLRDIENNNTDSRLSALKKY